MRIRILVILLLFALRSLAQLPSTADSASLVKDFRSWWNYYNAYTLLSADFIPLNTNHEKISKAQFLDSLVTGRYIPQRTGADGDEVSYRLLLLATGEENLDMRNIRASIQTVAFEEQRNFSHEGQQLPSYDFTDLKGRHYTNGNTKDKILVLKYWFINCLPCVQEMPELNELVKKYRRRKDILFVSVAMDRPDALQRFLLDHEFSYAVVPDQKSWLTDTMKAYSYPTHIIVDKSGRIVKVVNTASGLKQSLTKALAQ
ncbi:MAG: TlpA family protein disulfide reductase [Chitinophagaceae bacterium]|nr:TlpA family protein disulfide reductase [Chitinophagaceae bacterium]